MEGQREGSRFFAEPVLREQVRCFASLSMKSEWLRMTRRDHRILEKSTSQLMASPTGGYRVIFVAAFGSKDA